MASIHNAARSLRQRSHRRHRPSRRAVLQGLGLAAGGLLIGIPTPAPAQTTAPAQGGGQSARASSVASFPFGMWLHLGADGYATLIFCQSEMGQGITTALPMLVAEELDLPLTRVRVQMAQADRMFRNTYVVKSMLSSGKAEALGPTGDWILEKLGSAIGQQVTGGSTTIRWLWQPLRAAGAEARARLVAAAAAAWNVPASECSTADGMVSHAASGKSAGYGALAEAAAKLPAPADVRLKDPKDWKLIGQPQPRLDTSAKITGQAQFGIDVRIPGQLFGIARFAPMLGGTLRSLDASAALKLPGVKAVVPLSDGFVAVADSTWRANVAADQVKPTWQPGPRPLLDSATIERDFSQALVSGKPSKAHAHGDAAAALGRAAKVVQAEYHLPYLAHATLEPMNATVRLGTDGFVDVWAPTQAQETARKAAADATGVDLEKVRVHTTLLGGGFGRRAEFDFVGVAAQVAKAVPGVAVQSLWPREEDMRRDFYRPASLHRVQAGIDARGNISGWQQVIVTPSIMARVFPPVTWMLPDETSFEGAAEAGYTVPDLHIGLLTVETALPVGFWRSVGHSHTAFVKETMIDRLARESGADPLEFRLRLAAGSPRHAAVLKLLAEKAGWGTPLPQGQFRGLALHTSFGAIVAQAVEIAYEPSGAFRVLRVVCVADIGIVVNPNIARAQFEGAAVFGLAAALHGEITVRNGAVEQANYDSYQMPKLADIPAIDVHFVGSTARPAGVGEPGTPPLAPALANALLAASGKPITRLPLLRASV